MICFQPSTISSSIFIPLKPTSSGALCSRKHTPSKLDMLLVDASMLDTLLIDVWQVDVGLLLENALLVLIDVRTYVDDELLVDARYLRTYVDDELLVDA